VAGAAPGNAGSYRLAPWRGTGVVRQLSKYGEYRGSRSYDLQLREIGTVEILLQLDGAGC
jgi:hypothetical protein